MTEPYDPLDELTAMMAATVAARDKARELGCPELDDRILHVYRDIALRARERSVREAVAEDIEDFAGDLEEVGWTEEELAPFRDCARIARGGDEASRG